MAIADFRAEPADFVADFDDLRNVREAVFVVEQQIPKDIEFDNIDPSCYHFIARDVHHNAIGTARLSPDQKLGRMAVLPEWRNKGVGKALLISAIDKARKLGWTEIFLNSQVAATGFYEKAGFVKQGQLFNEANIPHQTMYLAITPINVEARRPAPKPRQDSIPAVKTRSLDEITPPVIELINNASRQICIYTLDLDYHLYGQSGVIAALKQFAISTRGGSISIIIHDVLAIPSQAHPIFELAHRLPSTFLLRTPVEVEDLKYSSAFIANDREGYLFQLFNNRYQADWSPNLPSRNRQLVDEFDRIWQRSRPCSEFRVLGI